MHNKEKLFIECIYVMLKFGMESLSVEERHLRFSNGENLNKPINHLQDIDLIIWMRKEIITLKEFLK